MADAKAQDQNGNSKIIRLGFDDLNSRYEHRTSVFRAECVFVTECVGGQPADESGIRQFVMHHLKITEPEEIEKAVRRIQDEELEEITPPEGEIKEVGRVRGWKYSLANPDKPHQLYVVGKDDEGNNILATVDQRGAE